MRAVLLTALVAGLPQLTPRVQLRFARMGVEVTFHVASVLGVETLICMRIYSAALHALAALCCARSKLNFDNASIAEKFIFLPGNPTWDCGSILDMLQEKGA